MLHTHASYPVGHLTTMYGLGLQPDDMHLNISSPGWAKHAWSNVFAPWNAGATAVALTGRFEARAALDHLAALPITSFCAPPTVWRQFIQLDLGQWKVALREICSSGEPLNPDVIEKVRRAWGLTLRDCYGQTETTMMVGNPPGQKLVVGAMGRPLPGYRVVLLDVEGLESDYGEIALPLSAQHLGLTAGYLDDDGALEAIEGEHYRTGDIASRDGEGFLTYVGRADDLFKSSDYRLSPFELESALVEHPLVAEAAVAPARDPIRQTTPKAYVVLAKFDDGDRAAALSLFSFLRDRLAPYKRDPPHRVRRRAAEDDVGQNPPRRAAPARSRTRRSRRPRRARIPRRGFSRAGVRRRRVRSAPRAPSSALVKSRQGSSSFVKFCQAASSRTLDAAGDNGVISISYAPSRPAPARSARRLRPDRRDRARRRKGKGNWSRSSAGGSEKGKLNRRQTYHRF